MEIYNQLNKPIFFQPWWLDIVCKKGAWDVCISRNEEGKIQGVLAYYLVSVFRFKIIKKPPFTPYLGIWLNYDSCSDRLVNRYSYENKIIEDLISQLPKVSYYHQTHPLQLKNWLPFYWEGYQQSTRYTFVFEKKEIDVIWGSMRSDVRNKINKAEKQGVKVTPSNNFELFYLTLNKTFAHQNINLKKYKELLIELHKLIQEKKQGEILLASDPQHVVHAAMYLIWDRDAAYCWLLGADINLRKSGAVQLLIWSAIKKSVQLDKKFNFEGSMLPHIEPVFRAFGAERKPVFQIKKSANKVLEIIRILLKN